MNAKAVLRVALLGFVVVAVVMIIRHEIAGGDRVGASDDAVAESLPADGLLVYYFHGDVRCPTCRTIEDCARQAVDTGFAAEIESGQVTWQVVNYEVPGNAHFIDQFELVSPTVVLVRREGGREVDWRNLARVWELVGSPAELVDYVQQETAQLLAAK